MKIYRKKANILWRCDYDWSRQHRSVTIVLLIILSVPSRIFRYRPGASDLIWQQHLIQGRMEDLYMLVVNLFNITFTLHVSGETLSRDDAMEVGINCINARQKGLYYIIKVKLFRFALSLTSHLLSYLTTDYRSFSRSAAKLTLSNQSKLALKGRVNSCVIAKIPSWEKVTQGMSLMKVKCKIDPRINLGIPKGSNFGPIFFPYFHQLYSHLFQFGIYAGDTTIYSLHDKLMVIKRAS